MGKNDFKLRTVKNNKPVRYISKQKYGNRKCLIVQQNAKILRTVVFCFTVF